MDQQFRRGTRRDPRKQPRHPRKQPNALKHGVFTPITVLPGENPDIFATLHSGVIQEWNPDGPTEEDAVLTIAKGMWRKARIQKFLRGKIVARTLDGSHPACDRFGALKGVCGVLEVTPSCIDELIDRLPQDLQERLNRQVPKFKFETDEERAQAIRNEINTVILPELQRYDKPLDVSFVEASELVTPEEFMHEIVLEERIDAMIDRAIKRLIQSKTTKALFGQQTSCSQSKIRWFGPCGESGSPKSKTRKHGRSVTH